MTTSDDIIYYEPTMVLNIVEYDSDNDKDTELFIVYDHDEELFYVYGHRGSSKSKHIPYTRSFECPCQLYDFLSLTIDMKHMKSYSISVNQLEGLSSYDDYYDYKRKISGRNEIVAYDNQDKLSRSLFMKWLRAYLL